MLMVAAQSGHTDVVSVLVGAGAALDAVDKVGLCRAAAYACMKACVGQLRRRPPGGRCGCGWRSGVGWSGVLYAGCGCGGLWVVLPLQGRWRLWVCVVTMFGICFGWAAAVPQDGRTALMLAALLGHTEAVSVLAGAGAALDARDKVGLCRAAAHACMQACLRGPAQA